MKNTLSPGDEIEYSLSQEIPYPKGATTWVKYGAKTTIRSGETPMSARLRLQSHVENALDKKVNEIVGMAK